MEAILTDKEGILRMGYHLSTTAETILDSTYGKKSRLDNLMALFLDEQLKDFDIFGRHRKSL